MLTYVRSFGLRASLLFACALTVPSAAPCQTPLGPDILLSTRTVGDQYMPMLGCNEDAVCALIWSSLAFDEVGSTWLDGRTLSAQGRVIAESELRMNDHTRLAPVVAGPDGFAVFWNRQTYAGPEGPSFRPMFQLFDKALHSLGDAIEVPVDSPGFPFILGSGRTHQGYVLLTAGFDAPNDDPECERCRHGIFLYFIDELGQPTHVRQVNEDSAANERPTDYAGLGMDGQGNAIVAFWRGYRDDYSETDIYVRRFSPEGQLLGPEVRANTYLPGLQWNPAVAAAPNGEFLVVWQSPGRDVSSYGIYARRFSADGQPAGDEFRVSQAPVGLTHLYPRVAADSEGNFAVTWQDLQATSFKIRLFRPDGSPVAGEVLLNETRNLVQEGVAVTFAPNGTLLVGWAERARSAPGISRSAYRRFAASPGDEPCAVAGARFLCDTGRTGGAPELSLTFGGRPGEVTLLGDADGDGRDDVCAWWQGVFRCDLDHEGTPAEWKVAFGRLTDTPLLGDVDGDGQAEPCLRRKRQLRCASGHGVTAIALPHASGIPLLGDLDGDGRDDVCLMERGVWTCLTRKGVRTSFSFGGRDDAPALGDLDRDGRSDPCVLRGGRLLCDTAHDGGQAETFLNMELPAGARPLFGNIDGL